VAAVGAIVTVLDVGETSATDTKAAAVGEALINGITVKE